MDRSVKIPLYKGILIISVNTTLKESFDRNKFCYDKQAEHYDEVTFRAKDDEYYVFVTPKITHGRVASLARKVCKLVFERERIKQGPEQIGHECRLIEWIVDEIYIILNDTKIKTIYAEN
jgi:hypothetical protein